MFTQVVLLGIGSISMATWHWKKIEDERVRETILKPEIQDYLIKNNSNIVLSDNAPYDEFVKAKSLLDNRLEKEEAIRLGRN